MTSTPILDRESPYLPVTKPGKKAKAFALLLISPWVLFLLVQIYLAHPIRYQAYDVDRADGVLLRVWLLSFLSLIVATCPAILIHEAAHVLMGLCLGFRFYGFRLGKLHVAALGRRPFMAPGGDAATYLLPAPSSTSPVRLAILLLAGPAANLITGFAGLFLSHHFGLLSSAFVWVSLVTGFTNLLPFRHGATRTDGEQFWGLVKNRACRQRWVALVKLMNASEKGARANDFPPEVLAKAIAVMDDSPDTVRAHVYAYAAASARGDIENAADYYETALTYASFAPCYIQEMLMCDAGAFQATKRKRLDLAEQWLSAMPGKTTIPWLRASLEAAIREEKGDIEGAVQQLEAIEKVILAFPEPEFCHRTHRSLLIHKEELLSQLGVGRHSANQSTP